MGARMVLCDPHRVVVVGPSQLHGGVVESPDIRAGMALLIAALGAEGESEIYNVGQIERGYERIDERLRALGANISRADSARRRRAWMTRQRPMSTSLRVSQANALRRRRTDERRSRQRAGLGGASATGIRTGIGILTAFKEAIEETLEEAGERGDLSPRARQAVPGRRPAARAGDLRRRARAAGFRPAQGVRRAAGGGRGAARALDALEARRRAGTALLPPTSRRARRRRRRDHRSEDAVGAARGPHRHRALAPGDVPLWVHPEWEERFPWLAQGTTGRGSGDEPFDLGLFGASRWAGAGPLAARCARRRDRRGRALAPGARGRHLRSTASAGAPGILVMDGYDGHVTAAPALLLAVSVADCVPVSIVDPRDARRRAGARRLARRAAGIVEHAHRRSWRAGSPRRAALGALRPGDLRGVLRGGPRGARGRPPRPPRPRGPHTDRPARRHRRAGAGDGAPRRAGQRLRRTARAAARRSSSRTAAAPGAADGSWGCASASRQRPVVSG